MELFRETNIDFLGKKRLTLGLSIALVLASIASLVVRGGPKWGIDFRGGTLVYVKFRQQPPLDQVRSALEKRIAGEISVQEELTGSREVIIGTEMKDASALGAARQAIIQTLAERFGQTGTKLDFNNAGQQALVDRLRDPLQRNSVALSEQQLQELAGRMLRFRDRDRSGLVGSFDELAAVEGVTPQVIATLKQEAALAQFTIRQVEIVGPKVGADLREKALLATLYALGGMLVYIAFRFEFIAGVAAIIAIIHDTIITVGFFSFLGREISLTVIAALLALIGYSMNDKIVVFDRVRENLKLRFRDKLPALINRSINQTLSRTMLTAGPTLLCTVALYFLGGPVLNGIALTLFIGIIAGTYSSIFIASAILIAWQNFTEGRGRRAGAPAAAAVSNRKEPAQKGSSRAVKQV
ncbi:MAG: protein translocase subunit SecF [Acidobacteriota bacterium]